jgi:hypothetical protein
LADLPLGSILSLGRGKERVYLTRKEDGMAHRAMETPTIIVNEYDGLYLEDPKSGSWSPNEADAWEFSSYDQAWHWIIERPGLDSNILDIMVR